jgi:hypothetical protein
MIPDGSIMEMNPEFGRIAATEKRQAAAKHFMAAPSEEG